MKTFLRPILSGLVFGIFLMSVPSAHAFSDFTVSDLSGVSQSMVHDLIGTAAVGTTHRAYMPATAMGWTIGVDMGIEATGVRLPNSFKNDIGTISKKAANDVPSMIPVPKFNMHKGLPFGLDLGLSYIGYQDKIKVIGGDAKWEFTSLIKGAPLSAAFRLNYTNEKLWYIKASNWQTDLLVSKDLLIIEPYVGTGLQFWSGNIVVPTGLAASSGLPTSVSAEDSGTNMHFFAGVPLKLALFWLSPEVDYSTFGVFSAGMKFSLNF